jgi:ABC-2 type transport system permease protein/lipopolysaccharide transport system permease protein
MSSNVQDLQRPADVPSASVPSAANVAWHDIWEGLHKSWFWGALAMQDVRLRYRGSIIGPFWLTLSMAIMIGAMGLIYSKLFNQDTSSYLPFLATGLIVWNFISNQINEGCQTFIGAQSLIQSVALPYSVHVYRLVMRGVIMLAHNLVILPVVLIFYHVPPTRHTFEALPAFALLCLNCVWLALVLGMISARFRDVPLIVQNFVTILFFVTPIFFPPSALGTWQEIAQLNPLFAAVDILRAPLMGQAPAAFSWPIMLAVTGVGSVVAFLFFSRFSPRIAYWV